MGLQSEAPEAEDGKRPESWRKEAGDRSRPVYVEPLGATFCFSAHYCSCFTIDRPFVSVVPNGPAESDSEPANQMSWKEGRQLLRK